MPLNCLPPSHLHCHDRSYRQCSCPPHTYTVTTGLTDSALELLHLHCHDRSYRQCSCPPHTYTVTTGLTDSALAPLTLTLSRQVLQTVLLPPSHLHCHDRSYRQCSCPPHTYTVTTGLTDSALAPLTLTLSRQVSQTEPLFPTRPTDLHCHDRSYTQNPCSPRALQTYTVTPKTQGCGLAHRRHITRTDVTSSHDDVCGYTDG